jgi:Fic family protein
MANWNHFSQAITAFHEKKAPEPGYIAGYGAIIHAYNLTVPLPDRLSIISLKHKKYETEEWLVFTPRHQPEDSLQGHLVFALKNEGIELLTLKALFTKIDPDSITSLILKEPTGQYSRKIWFLYEWLTGNILSVPDLSMGNLVDVVDSELQYPGPPEISKRHRVRNNLPGVRDFCPMIRRTSTLDDFIHDDFKNKAKDDFGTIRRDIMLRAASFLLLKDSQASYAIEGEVPTHNRATRWGKAIEQAGQKPLSKDELVRLQQIVIDNPRFTKLGFRNAGGFVGEHDRETGVPIPEHISARWEDVENLINGLIATDQKLASGSYDAVLTAAVIAFGFVFIHPFFDGNGRIHRYLIHHVLSEKGFTSSGIIFPVSYAILERLEDYKKVLNKFSSPRLDFIQWRETDDHNIEVLNDTSDLYRYFDATKQAEFLYDCVRHTVEVTIPVEVEYLKNYDRFKTFLDDRFQMPDKTVDLLVRFLQQGKGKLSNRTLQKEFNTLNDSEIQLIETQYIKSFFDSLRNPIFCDAIKNKQRIRFEYNGKTRVVEPQCYGIGTTGTELLRGYELSGNSKNAEKLYDLSKASSLELINEHFTSPAPNYRKSDSSMKTIFCEL